MRVLRRWCGTVSLRARAANQHPNFSELPPYIAQDQAKDMHRPLPSAPAGRQPLATVYPENDITPINSGSQPPAGFETYRAVPESHHEPNVFKPPSPTIHAQLASNASPPRRNSSVPPPQVPQAQTHTPFLPPQPSSQEHFKNYPQQPQRGVMAPGSPRMMPPQQVPSNYQGGNRGANEGRRPAVSQMRTQQRNQPIMLPDPTPGSQTSPRVPSSWSPRGTFYHPVMTPYGVQLQLFQMPGGSVSPRSSTPRRNITPLRQSTPGRGTSIMHSSASKPRASMGISLGRTDNNDVNGPVFILAIHPHGPAGRKHNPTSTLEPMQELLSVDGWSVQGQTMASISSQCAGDVGTRAVLEVRAAPSQGGQIFRVEIQRAQTPFDLGVPPATAGFSAAAAAAAATAGPLPPPAAEATVAAILAEAVSTTSAARNDTEAEQYTHSQHYPCAQTRVSRLLERASAESRTGSRRIHPPWDAHHHCAQEPCFRLFAEFDNTGENAKRCRKPPGHDPARNASIAENAAPAAQFCLKCTAKPALIG